MKKGLNKGRIVKGSKDWGAAWVPGTGEELSKAMELVISPKKMRKGEVRGIHPDPPWS